MMFDFICMGLLELQGTQSKQEIQNENSGPQCDSKLGYSAYEAETLPIAQRDLISIIGYNMCAFYLYHVLN